VDSVARSYTRFLARRQRRKWAAFTRRDFGEPFYVWHDGPSFDVVRAHWESDPRTVDLMLRTGVRLRDPLAAAAMGALFVGGLHSDEYTQGLIAALADATGHFRIAAAEALIALTGNQQWADDIVSVLQDDKSPFVRPKAARALALVDPTAAVVDALARAVSDPDYFVRYHAANSPLSQSGAGVTVEREEWLFNRIRRDHARPEWLKAATRLRERFPNL
jgi:hypothetical protein